jgi:hypothetical protein
VTESAQEVTVDPVSLILTALTADVPDTTGPGADELRAVIRTGQAKLQDDISRRLTGWLPQEIELTDQGELGGGRALLARALLESRAADDPDLIQTATQVLRALDEAGYHEGRYVVDLRGLRGLHSVVDVGR